MNEFTEKLIVTMVVVTVVLGVFRGAKEMGIIAGVFVAALFFSNLDKFSRFKGAGIEAEMASAVSKAYAAIEQLKELGLNLSTPIVDELAVSGRMLQYIPLKYKLEQLEKIRENLKNLGASDKEIEQACSTLYERVTDDHVRRILYILKNDNPAKVTLFDGIDDGKFNGWKIERLTAFVAENGLILGAEAKEWIADLDYFLTSRKLRREDKWQS